MMLNDLNVHFITQLPQSNAAFAKRSLFGKAICSLSSHLLYLLLSVKGLLPSLSREVDALRCALHHFRLADETAQGAFSLRVCQRRGGGEGGERGESECTIRGEKRNHLRLSDGFCDSPIRRKFKTETEKRCERRKEQRE